MLCAEPKEHKRFRPGTWPAGIGFPAGRMGDRGDREVVYVPNVYVPFPAPRKGLLKTSTRRNAIEAVSIVNCSLAAISFSYSQLHAATNQVSVLTKWTFL